MKKKSTTIESNLIMKSTAQLREEIISELTMPDRSLSCLLEEKKEKDIDETQDEQGLCD
jgi:hypothetical protein